MKEKEGRGRVCECVRQKEREHVCVCLKMSKICSWTSIHMEPLMNCEHVWRLQGVVGDGQ